MNWPDRCAAVIPCLNEQTAIGGVVTAVKHHLPHVFVIDDGSSDHTASAAEQAGARVLRHPQPRGKGAALQTGWTAARDAGFQWALTMDGDGQHAPEDIPAFLQRAEQTRAALIVGNRMNDTRGMPFIRRCVNWWMSRQLSRLAGCPMPDSQSGYRLMNLDAWAALHIQAAHFEVESEILIEFARSSHRIDFVPIQVIYRDERSKIHPLRDTIRWFRWRQRVKGVSH